MCLGLRRKYWSRKSVFMRGSSGVSAARARIISIFVPPSRKRSATYTSSDSSEIYRLSAQAKKLIRSVTKELPDEEVAKDHFNIYLCDVPMLLGCIDMKLLIGGKADLEDVAGFQPRVVV